MTRHQQDRDFQEPVVATNYPINLQCKDCQQAFIFTVGEQQFFEKKRFSQPVRCPDCRARRKKEKAEQAGRY